MVNFIRRDFASHRALQDVPLVLDDKIFWYLISDGVGTLCINHMDPRSNNTIWTVSHFTATCQTGVDLEQLVPVLGMGRVIAEETLKSKTHP